MKFFASIIYSLVCITFSAACSNADTAELSQLTSHSTQSWSVSEAAASFSAVAESGPCATNLPRASLASDYCFNAIPVAELSVSGSSIGVVCVATHLAGFTSDAALIVVDSRGDLAGEALGRGSMQIVAALSKQGPFKVYAGFNSPAAGQKVRVLAGLSRQFAVNSAACSLK